MFLTCDIGNSRIKAGLFSGNKLSETFSFENVEQLQEVFRKKQISGTGISSVVPESSHQLINFLENRSQLYHRISKDSRFNLKINYKTPSTLGTDRICSAEGALLLNGVMNDDEIILTIDLGTATTINIVKFPPEFIGGVIAPGVTMMGKALHSYTAQLPLAGFTDFESIIGNSTRSSIASGLINSALGMIDRIIVYIKKTFHPAKISIFMTGGNAEKLFPYIDFEFVYEKDLVLYGIKAIASLNLP